MVPTEHAGLDATTLAIVAGRGAEAPGDPLNVPVHFASAFHADGPTVYARDDNPSWAAFEQAVGALEGGAAVVFASGMAAVGALLAQVPTGGLVVAPADAYTGTRTYLQDAESRGRLRVRLVNVADTAATTAACDGADVLWVESPTNPLMAVADIPALCRAAHDAAALAVVDNTFATPVLQQPLMMGADAVVHSGSKFIGGHSDLVIGAAVTNDPELLAALRSRRTVSGAIAGPMETYLALRGLRTLPLRVERAQITAQRLAEGLAAHPRVSRVRYPGLPSDAGHRLAGTQMRGFGAVLSFEVADADSAERVCGATRLIVHATSLGGVETTMERRRRHPGEDLVPDGLVRISVGCEHPDDLWADLARALEQA